MNTKLVGNLLFVICLFIAIAVGVPHSVRAEDAAVAPVSEEDAKMTAPAETSQTSAVAPAATPASKIDTREIQKALTQAGFFKGTVDGTMGPQTRRAIRAFQEANGLAVDGKCGPKTWDKLKMHLEEKAPAVEKEAAPAAEMDSGSSVSGGNDAFDTARKETNALESRNLKQKLVS